MRAAVNGAGLRTAAALGLVLSLEAAAQEAGGPHGVAIAAIGLVPTYEDADIYRTFPILARRVQWVRRYVALQGLTMLANVGAADGVAFGPLVTLNFGRTKDIDPYAVAALLKISAAASVGLFAARVWRGVGTASGAVRLHVQAAHDVTDVYGGWIGAASASHMTPLGQRWLVAGELVARVVSDDYAATHFSVDAADTAASGLAPFAAKGGLNDVGISLTSSFAVTERWSLTGFAGYSHLLGDASDSPNVPDEGSTNQLSAGLGLGFNS